VGETSSAKKPPPGFLHLPGTASSPTAARPVTKSAGFDRFINLVFFRNCMESWLPFAILSAITAALVAIFGKIGIKDIDPNVATTIRIIVMFFTLLAVVILTGKLNEIPSVIRNTNALFYIIISGIAGALSWLFYFVALKLGQASQVAPIDRLSVVFVIIFAFLILGERISLRALSGVALMSIGAILVALG
jgi:transporter family protein